LNGRRWTVHGCLPFKLYLINHILKTEILVKDLQDESRFQLIDQFHIDELKEFVVENMKAKTKYTWFYNIFFMTITILGFGYFTYTIGEEGANTKLLIAYFGGGIAIAFTLAIAFHDWIHGMTYKMGGASKIVYGGEIKKFVFYAAAPMFVLGKDKFFKVAMAPFVIITLLAVILFTIGSIEIKCFALGLLIAHTMACGGDFALMSFFEKNKDKEILTYDDMENKTIYFYEKKQ